MIQPLTQRNRTAVAWARSAAAVRLLLTAGRAGSRTAPHGLPPVPRLGDLEVRLARGRKELRRVQRVRYKVFFEHGSATPSRAAARRRRDLCPFDAVCDHLVVIDHGAKHARTGRSRPRIVGTYRLLRQEIADRCGGFYTAREFDIAPLVARHPDKRFLELGRSCVLPRYRAKRTIELLWKGISAYVNHHGIDVLIGCASLEGTDLAGSALPLRALRELAPADPNWRAPPRPGRETCPVEASSAPIGRRDALACLPPLIKGYLRAGARFGEEAVVDREFGTIDVLTVLPLSALDGRYRSHFGTVLPDVAGCPAP